MVLQLNRPFGHHQIALVRKSMPDVHPAALQACMTADGKHELYMIVADGPSQLCRLAKSPLQVEYIPLPRERSFLDKLLPLYKQTGEKNGFCVLDEHEFYEFHMNTPDLTIMLIKVELFDYFFYLSQ